MVHRLNHNDIAPLLWDPDNHTQVELGLGLAFVLQSGLASFQVRVRVRCTTALCSRQPHTVRSEDCVVRGQSPTNWALTWTYSWISSQSQASSDLFSASHAVTCSQLVMQSPVLGQECTACGRSFWLLRWRLISYFFIFHTYKLFGG